MNAAPVVTSPQAVNDALGRALRCLRISLTDRCNLRCEYCMPEDQYAWLPRGDLLTRTEIVRLAKAFARLGVDRIRLTGGEPLVRPDVAAIVEALRTAVEPRDLAMTTNAVLLRRHAHDLAAAGLSRVTVSLDTLHLRRFAQLTRRDSFADVLDGIAAARDAGLPLKINTVVMRGFNDDELVPLVEFGRDTGAEVRFIEYMDVGGATRWDRGVVVTKAEMLSRLVLAFGPLEPVATDVRQPADQFRLGDGTVVGVIASVSEPFCQTCDRSRITADGTWLRCLYATSGTDLRTPMRDGASDEELERLIEAGWSTRTDRGAEDRARHRRRVPLAVNVLQHDPHLEMHTRGG